MKVAIIQAEAAADLETGLELTREKALKGAGTGAELIVFPETWLARSLPRRRAVGSCAGQAGVREVGGEQRCRARPGAGSPGRDRP